MNKMTYDYENQPWLKIGWKPECKGDIVNLLLDVQVGNISCGRAAEILLPNFCKCIKSP